MTEMRSQQVRSQFNRIINIGAIGLLLLIALVRVWPFIKPAPYWFGIRPVTNSDGTVDYTIRTIVDFDNSSRDRYWVLRFPKDAWVDDGWNSTPASVSVPNGPSISFGAQRRNHSVSFYFDPFKGQIASSRPEQRDENLYYVIAGNEIQSGSDVQRHVDLLLQHFELKHCEFVIDERLGATLYFAKDDLPGTPVSTEPSDDAGNPCRSTRDSPTFHFKNSNGNVEIMGSCSGNWCYFVFRSANSRRVSWFHHRKLLPRLRGDVQSLSNLLEKLTVSSN
jgi:hypothetical protein